VDLRSGSDREDKADLEPLELLMPIGPNALESTDSICTPRRVAAASAFFPSL